MGRINVVGFSPTPELGGWAQYPRGDLAAIETALRQQMLFNQGQERDEDQALRALALLLGAEQTSQQLGLTREQITEQGRQFTETLGLEREQFGEAKRQWERESKQAERQQEFNEMLALLESSMREEELGITREQLGRQGEQFEKSLKAQREESRADRTLRLRELEQMDEQNQFIRNQAEVDRNLAQASDDSTKVLHRLQRAKEMGLLDLQDQGESARRTAETQANVFRGRVNSLLMMGSDILDSDALEKRMPEIRQAVESFDRSIRNTLLDAKLEAPQRVGAATALQTLPGSLFEELHRLKAIGNKAQRQELDELINAVKRLSLLGTNISDVMNEFEVYITGGTAKRDLLRQVIEREDQLTEDLQRIQNAGGRLPLGGTTLNVPRLDPSRLLEVLPVAAQSPLEFGQPLEPMGSGLPLPLPEPRRELEEDTTEIIDVRTGQPVRRRY